ncbi:MAG TPA: hypothetical protein VNX47_05925 [Nevskia sp.]|jgi:hypothetical protein|nr:hypothetical protein [Nevskia sp.]
MEWCFDHEGLQFALNDYAGALIKGGHMGRDEAQLFATGIAGFLVSPQAGMLRLDQVRSVARRSLLGLPLRLKSANR